MAGYDPNQPRDEEGQWADSDDKVVAAVKASSDYYNKTRNKWDPDAEQWEEYLEREYPDLDEFFKNGGTNRKALALMDKGEANWSPGALKYFKDKYKKEKVSTLSSEDARLDRILRIRDSTGRATSRRW